jgi:hypothetical protein
LGCWQEDSGGKPQALEVRTAPRHHTVELAAFHFDDASGTKINWCDGQIWAGGGYCEVATGFHGGKRARLDNTKTRN